MRQWEDDDPPVPPATTQILNTCTDVVTTFTFKYKFRAGILQENNFVENDEIFAGFRDDRHLVLSILETLNDPLRQKMTMLIIQNSDKTDNSNAKVEEVKRPGTAGGGSEGEDSGPSSPDTLIGADPAAKFLINFAFEKLGFSDRSAGGGVVNSGGKTPVAPSPTDEEETVPFLDVVPPDSYVALLLAAFSHGMWERYEQLSSALINYFKQGVAAEYQYLADQTALLQAVFRLYNITNEQIEKGTNVNASEQIKLMASRLNAIQGLSDLLDTVRPSLLPLPTMDELFRDIALYLWHSQQGFLLDKQRTSSQEISNDTLKQTKGPEFVVKNVTAISEDKEKKAHVSLSVLACLFHIFLEIKIEDPLLFSSIVLKLSVALEKEERGVCIYIYIPFLYTSTSSLIMPYIYLDLYLNIYIRYGCS